MPRVSGVYDYPPASVAVTNTTISSVAHNSYIDDIKADLNAPRPITAGGTGATNANAACDALGAVKKIGDTMTGALTIDAAWSTLSLKTPDVSTGCNIIGWQGSNQSWALRLGDGTSRDFNVIRFDDAGGNTIPLSIKRATGDAYFGTGIFANTGVVSYGAVTANAGVVSYGGRVVSTMPGASDQPAVACWSSGRGAAMCMFLDTSNRLAFGTADGAGNPTANWMSLTSGGLLTIDSLSANSALVYGNIDTNSNIGLGRYNLKGGTLFFGYDGTAYLQHDTASTFYLRGGNLNAQNIAGVDISGSSFYASNCYFSTNGFRSNNTSNTFQIMLSVDPAWGSQCLLYANHIPGVKVIWNFAVASVNYEFDHVGTARKPGGGSWVDISDARIKTVLGNYDHGLDEVLQLNPVRFVYKGNDTQSIPAHIVDSPDGPEREERLKEFEGVELTAPYKNSTHYQMAVDQKEYVGFIAQDVETVMPEMVSQHSGFIDGNAVTDIRELDTNALIFALVNAVKTLAARVETLEAAAGG